VAQLLELGNYEVSPKGNSIKERNSVSSQQTHMPNTRRFLSTASFSPDAAGHIAPPQINAIAACLAANQKRCSRYITRLLREFHALISSFESNQFAMVNGQHSDELCMLLKTEGMPYVQLLTMTMTMPERRVSSQNEISTKNNILRCARHTFATGEDNYTATFHKERSSSFVYRQENHPNF
jgi:hypothetical protein